MSKKHLIFGMAFGKVGGAHPGAWRMPGATPNPYTNVEDYILTTQAAERGGMDFVFFPDRVFLYGDLTLSTPSFSIDPLVILTVLARETSHIGLIASASTSFNEPYTLARQLRAIDVISHGRAGWNAIPSYEPEAFANYGLPVPIREEKYERLHESIQVTQALWGSWKPEAGQPDPASGKYANMNYIRPIHMQGKHVGSRGPLQIPPSEQGQPVILMPFASGLGIQAAGIYSDLVFGGPSTIKESRAQMEIVREAAVAGGRSATDVKFLVFINFSLGATKREALDRRRKLEEKVDISPRLAQLSRIIGIPLDISNADKPLTNQQLVEIQSNGGHGKSSQAIQLAIEGWSPLDIIAHGILDTMGPFVVGTPTEAADLLQEWFEADACDGFILIPDDHQDNVDDFSNQVIPILRQRGLRPDDYLGSTLRSNLGLSEQLGIDPRLL